MSEMRALDNERVNAGRVEFVENSGDLFIHQRGEHATVARVLGQARLHGEIQRTAGSCARQKARHSVSDREFDKMIGVDAIGKAIRLAAKRRGKVLKRIRCLGHAVRDPTLRLFDGRESFPFNSRETRAECGGTARDGEARALTDDAS